MATACRQIRHNRKAGRGEHVEFPAWATLVVGRGLVFPPACEEPSLLKASKRPVQSSVGRETTSAFLVLDLPGYSETMKLPAPSGPEIHCSNKNRLFDWNECARLASHNLYNNRYLRIREPCNRCDGAANGLNHKLTMPVAPAHGSEAVRRAFTQGNLICLRRACRRRNMRRDRPPEYYLGGC